MARYREGERRRGEKEETTGGWARWLCTACLCACMAAYKKLRRPGEVCGMGASSERKKLDEDEEDTEEAVACSRVAGEWGIQTDHEEATIQRRTVVARRTERWKSILWNRSVFSELAPSCCQTKPEGESSWRLPSASYFERARNNCI